jgi:membrane associated rhomboid family serine protease
MHLVGNMLFLWIFGDNMEDAFGHLGYLIFYLASGIGADLAHVAMDPGSMVPMVGASGAIAGVLGGYLLLFPRARVDVVLILVVIFRRFALPAWTVLGLWFCFQIFNAVTADITAGGVAYWAHAGGFVFGLLFALPWWLRHGGRAFWDGSEGHPPHPPTDYPERMTPIPAVQRRR